MSDPLKCNECDYVARWNSELVQHRRTHTGEKPFRCDVCQKTYGQKRHLSEHMLTHLGDKRYQCDLCTYKTTRKSSLDKHRLTHTGEKPFVCDDCGYKANQESNMKRHARSHAAEAGVKPPTSLTLHTRTQYGNYEKPVGCEYCCYRGGNVTQHMKTCKHVPSTSNICGERPTTPASNARWYSGLGL